MNSELKKIEREKCKAISLNKWREAADASNYIGSELSRMGHFTEALQYHQEELTYNEMIQDRLGVAVANRRLGECYAELGTFKKALSHTQTFLQIAVDLNDKVEEQRAWATLGRTYYLKYVQERETDNPNLKTLDDAEHSYLKALHLSEDVKSDLSSKEYAEMKARCLLNLGLVNEWRGNIADCANNIRTAIFLASKYNLLEDLNRCQSSLANVFQKHGQYTHALRLLDGAIASAEKLNDKTLLCEELASKALILVSLKDFEGARCCLKKAYKLHSPIEADHDKISKYLKICTGLCVYQKKLQEMDSSESYERKLIFEKIADGLSYMENYKLALDFYLETLKCMEGNKFLESQKAPIYFSIAITYKDIGDKNKALEFLGKELKCNENDPSEQIKTLWKMAEVLEEVGNVEMLEKNYIRAVHIAQKNSDSKTLKHAYAKLLDFYEQNNMTENAGSIKSKLISSSFEDVSSDESEVEEDSQEPFDDIHLSELSDLKDTDSENEDVAGRSKRRLRKPSLKVNEKGETPLHQACINGNLTVVKRLVESGHPVNTRDFCGWTPLHEACNHGFYEIVEYLLDKGALVNDRGGPKCDGITPLHDAATCGHIDVMRLLISRGASVTAVDDSGLSPLQRLIEMRKTNQADLDAEDLRQCVKMEQELREKMAQAGQPAKDSDPANIDDCASSADLHFTDDSIRCDSTRLSEKRARSSSSSSEKDSDDEEIQNFSPYTQSPSPRNNWTADAKQAKSEYQAVMSSLRRSAKSSIPDPAPPPKIDKGTALVNEDEVISEWLIKDTNQVPKAKKKKRKMSRLQIRTSKSLYNYLAPTNESDSEDLEIDIMDNSNDASSNIDKSNEVPSAVNSVFNGASQISNVTEQSKFGIKVKIGDKIVYMHVPDDSCSIGWLAETTAYKYFTIEGRKPHLTLMTKDGALLSRSDLVKTLFVNNEEIASSVEFWDEPSLEERYVHLCSTNKVQPDPSIRKRILDFDTTHVMNISNYSMPYQQLRVICLTLRSTSKNLQHVDFSETTVTEGNPLADTIAKEIVHCFPAFTSLISLKMSCCCLTSESVKSISDYLQSQEVYADMKLPNLTTLVLGENIFNSDCASYFSAILRLPSLKYLDLYSCHLIPSFFENEGLCEALQNSSLEELNVANNLLSERSINNLLSSLPKEFLRKLDLSCVIKNNYGCMQQIGNFLSSSSPLLQEISLEDCHLKDEDLYILVNSSFYCPRLQSINISLNAGLSCTAVIDFLKAIISVNKTITKICCTGTCTWDMKNIITLIDILSSSNVSCIELDNVLPESCQAKLVEFWKNHWGSKAAWLACIFCKLSIV